MGGNEPEVESNGYAPKTRTSQIDECQRCGRKQGLVGKYDIYLCRQCFREIARDIGFRKYGGSSSSRSDEASTSFVPSAGSDPEADRRDSDEETDDKADLDLADSEVKITLDETDVEAQFGELASDLELSDREQEAVEQAIRDHVNDVVDENYANVGPEMRNAIANVVAATLKQEFQQLENDG